MKKWLDLPPIWLLGALMLVWWQSANLTMGLNFGGQWADFIGGILVGGSIVLMLLAAYEMHQQKTTIVPHRDADRLVQSGIFSRSRNPIYLGDALVLLGVILSWDAVLSLPLVPIFVWIIERRFIIPEENRLRRKFRADFARYEQKVRRWV